MAVGLRPETTSEDIFSACRDGDEFYCKEWSLNPENDLNITYVYMMWHLPSAWVVSCSSYERWVNKFMLVVFL